MRLFSEHRRKFNQLCRRMERTRDLVSPILNQGVAVVSGCLVEGEEVVIVFEVMYDSNGRWAGLFAGAPSGMYAPEMLYGLA